VEELILLLESVEEEGVYACEAIALLASGELGAMRGGYCKQSLA
jgi:hypothetical protein